MLMFLINAQFLGVPLNRGGGAYSNNYLSMVQGALI